MNVFILSGMMLAGVAAMIWGREARAQAYAGDAGDSRFSLPVLQLPDFNSFLSTSLGDLPSSGREQNLDVLARTLYGEARGEPDAGKVAVACVIVNRAHDGLHRWPATVSGVCLQSSATGVHQFSCWNTKDPNADIIRQVTDADPVFQRCITIAQGVLAGTTPDPTHGANHYYAKSMKQPPSWAANMQVTATIGHHIFLKG